MKPTEAATTETSEETKPEKAKGKRKATAKYILFTFLSFRILLLFLTINYLGLLVAKVRRKEKLKQKKERLVRKSNQKLILHRLENPKQRYKLTEFIYILLKILILLFCDRLHKIKSMNRIFSNGG